MAITNWLPSSAAAATRSAGRRPPGAATRSALIAEFGDGLVESGGGGVVERLVAAAGDVEHQGDVDAALGRRLGAAAAGLGARWLGARWFGARRLGARRCSAGGLGARRGPTRRGAEVDALTDAAAARCAERARSDGHACDAECRSESCGKQSPAPDHVVLPFPGLCRAVSLTMRVQAPAVVDAREGNTIPPQRGRTIHRRCPSGPVASKCPASRRPVSQQRYAMRALRRRRRPRRWACSAPSAVVSTLSTVR